MARLLYLQVPSRSRRKSDPIPNTKVTALLSNFPITKRFEQGDRDEEIELIAKLVRHPPTKARNNLLEKMLKEVL